MSMTHDVSETSPDGVQFTNVDIVPMGPEAYEMLSKAKEQKMLVDLNLRIYMLESLVRLLDPNHNYMFSEEYQAWLKIPKKVKEVGDGE